MSATPGSHAGPPFRATLEPVEPASPFVVPLGALFPYVEKDEDVVGTYPKHDEQG